MRTLSIHHKTMAKAFLTKQRLSYIMEIGKKYFVSKNTTREPCKFYCTVYIPGDNVYYPLFYCLIFKVMIMQHSFIKVNSGGGKDRNLVSDRSNPHITEDNQ